MPASLAHTPSTLQPLARLLNPRAVAIVGASADARSFGGFVLGNLERFGFAGAIHPVSRSSVEINGRPCVASPLALPEDVDVAVLAIPEAAVPQALQDLAARRCHAAVLFASGYAEAGAVGLARQEELAAAARTAGMLLLGPNCMGFTNFAAGVALTFEPLQATPREQRPGIAVLAQSGAMAVNMRDAFISRGLPVVTALSTGNEAGVRIEDALAHFIADAQTRVIAVYAEQLRAPQLFLALAQQARAAGKPIVLLMPGRSARAQQAAASHTGAMTADHAVASTLLQRQAVVQVGSIDELFDTTAILLRHPRATTRGTAFMTGSGALKNLALDFCDEIGLALPTLSTATVAALQAKLPAYAVAENPLDTTTIGVRQPGLVGELVHTLLSDENVGNLVLCIPVGPLVAQRDKADHIVPALAAAAKPAVLVLTGDASPIEPFFLEAIRSSGVPLFRSGERALRALANVANHGSALQRAQRSAAQPGATLPLPGPVPPNGIFAEYQGKQWLQSLGVPVPRGGLATELGAALRIARDIGYPVVLKAQASELPHKSDVGGVLVNLRDEAALRAGWATLHANVSHHRPELRLDGVLVEAMGAAGVELVLGARRDAAWGPVLLIGLGGVWIEVLKDMRLLAADVCEADIVSALMQLKAAPLLTGLRGSAAVDVAAIARVVAQVGAQMRANPAIREIDINPLVARPDGVLALDALLVVDAASPEVPA